MTQTRFETFSVSATYVATQAACVYSCTATADVKENLSYISVDYDTVHKSIEEFDKKKTYELPDRNIISIGAGRFRCVEVLFQPNFIREEASGFHDTSLQCNMKCDVYIRKELSNGTTMFQGILESMTKEPTALSPSTMKIKVFASPVEGPSLDWRIYLVFLRIFSSVDREGRVR